MSSRPSSFITLLLRRGPSPFSLQYLESERDDKSKLATTVVGKTDTARRHGGSSPRFFHGHMSYWRERWNERLPLTLGRPSISSLWMDRYIFFWCGGKTNEGAGHIFSSIPVRGVSGPCSLLSPKYGAFAPPGSCYSLQPPHRTSAVAGQRRPSVKMRKSPEEKKYIRYWDIRSWRVTFRRAGGDDRCASSICSIKFSRVSASHAG